MRIATFDRDAVAKAVKKSDGDRVKIGEWLPNPNYDGSMRVEVTEDEMKALFILIHHDLTAVTWIMMLYWTG